MKNMQKRIEQASKSKQLLKLWIQDVYSELSADSELALINLWGVRGSGKTKFIKEIEQSLKRMQDAVVLDYQNAAQLPYTELTARINQFVDNAPKDTKKVLLIDDLESISMDDGTDKTEFVEFETQVILNLIQRPDLLFIITSRHELRQWHHIEIKMRQTSLMLPPIDPKEINELAREIHTTPKKVYALTNGSPLALAYLKDHPDTSEDEIDQYIYDTIVGELPENIQDIALLASLLLDFDIAVLQSALWAVDLHSGDTYYDHTSSIQKLGIMGLIIHDIRHGSYHFTNEPLRRLLFRIYRNRGAEKFYAVHKQMAVFYQQEALRFTFLPQFLVNAIFHMAWANEHVGKDTGIICQKWIQSTIPIWTGANWKDVLGAWKTGRGKPDVVKEIIVLIGKNSYQEITKQIQDAGRL